MGADHQHQSYQTSGFLNNVKILRSRNTTLTILHDISGIIKPSRMTLLLGPPGAGKTTLLTTLAGKPDHNLKVTGTVTYSGHSLNEFVPQITSSYISQHDLHLHEMTVRETLDFSGHCQGVGARYEMMQELSRCEKKAGIKPDLDVDVFMKILGLDICANTMVGDWMHRGISWDQKKRVTTGAIAMTMFLSTKMHHRTVNDGNLYMGALFFGLVHVMFNGFPELSMTVSRLPVFYKQRDLMFYTCWAFSLPTWIMRIPLSLLEEGIWVCVTYYVMGFAPEAERFFRQFFLLFMMHQMSLALFKLIALMGRNMIVSQTFGSFALLIVFVLGGFVVSRESIPSWWIWAYWYSPMSYGQNAIAVNEFMAPRWNKPISNSSSEIVGRVVLESRGLFAEAKFYWNGIGTLIVFCVLFNVLSLLL